MYGAIDWSGTPDAPDQNPSAAPEVFLACAIVCSDWESVEQTLSEWRREDGRPKAYEFRGYHASDAVRERTARFLLEHVRIHAVGFDKSVLEAESSGEAFLRPALLAPATAGLILDRLLQEVPLHTIWHDEDIQKRERRLAYNKSIRSMARRYGRDSPILKHYPSSKSDMVQLADLACYILQRDLRGLPETEDLRRLARRLQQKEGNVMRWGCWDDLRAYL